MESLSLDQLIFKGTHNSYACRENSNSPPLMNHPPEIQVDDFGAWMVELDFGVVIENGLPRAVVGHDGPGEASCWGYYLTEYLERLHNTAALHYRPIFIAFDPKNGDDWPDLGLSKDDIRAVGVAELKDIFGSENVVVLDKTYLAQHNNQYPTIPELAGKAVLNSILRETYQDTCTSKQTVEQAIRSGTGLEQNCPGGCRVIRIDQYQADWTFEYGVPPNPLVVDSSATPPWTITDSVGSEWSCLSGDNRGVPCGIFPFCDVWKGQIVHEQGTCRFPYKTVGAAVTRAEGTTPNGVRDLRRAGFGWTILMRPGNYPETLTINIPLTLKKDDRPGTVIIGR